MTLYLHCPFDPTTQTPSFCYTRRPNNDLIRTALNQSAHIFPETQRVTDLFFTALYFLDPNSYWEPIDGSTNRAFLESHLYPTTLSQIFDQATKIFEERSSDPGTSLETLKFTPLHEEENSFHLLFSGYDATNSVCSHLDLSKRIQTFFDQSKDPFPTLESFQLFKEQVLDLVSRKFNGAAGVIEAVAKALNEYDWKEQFTPESLENSAAIAGGLGFVMGGTQVGLLLSATAKLIESALTAEKIYVKKDEILEGVSTCFQETSRWLKANLISSSHPTAGFKRKVIVIEDDQDENLVILAFENPPEEDD